MLGLGLFSLMCIPCAGFAQAQAQWLTPTRFSARNGAATLRWSVEGSEAVALFRISEESTGQHQISYTDQTEIRVVRSEPGDYSFRVQACKRYIDGYPLCGEYSNPLIVSVPKPSVDSSPSTGQKGEQLPARGNIKPQTCE